MGVNSFALAEEAALKSIKNIQSALTILDTTIGSINTKLSSMAQGGIGNDSAKVKELETTIKKLNSAFEEQQTQLKNLSSARKDEATAIQKQIELSAKNQNSARQTTREELKLEETYKKAFDTQQKLNSAYAQLIAKRNQAKQNLQNLIASEKASNAEIRKAQVEFNKLQGKVNQANLAVSNFNKTSLGGLVAGFRNLLGAFGIVGGVFMFAQFAKSVISTIKELDQLNFTLKTVIKTEGELARAKAFVVSLSEKYGAELLSTTNRYIKFNVAARQAGLELKKTERIFETVTEVSALLGLKTDELTGVYLALEQMLSKGKVTTEELRRQLGERLPGAFDLMAKALKVNTAELDKMLKAGDVLSKEALPLLIEEMRTFFGVTGEGVNTMQTATQKLSSSWTLFIEALNNSTGIGDIWQTILEETAVAIREITDAIKGVEGVAKSEASNEYFRQLQDNMDNTVAAHIRLRQASLEMEQIEDDIYEKRKKIQELEKQARMSFDSSEITKQIKEEQREIGKLAGKYDALYKFKELIRNETATQKKDLIGLILAYKDKNNIIETSLDLVKLEEMSVEQLRQAYSSLEKMVEEKRKNTIPYYEDLIKANEELRKSLKSTSAEDLAQVAVINKQNSEYQKQIDLLQGKADKLKEVSNALVGSVAYYEKIISELKKQQSELSNNNQKWTEFQDKIDDTQKKIDEIKGVIGDLGEELDALVMGWSQVNDAMRLTDKQIDKLAQGWEKQQKGIQDTDKELERLERRLTNWFNSFQEDLLGQAGFSTLNELMTIEENGLTTFDNLMKAAKESGKEFEFMFTSVTEVAQEAFAFLGQMSDAYFEKRKNNLEREKEVALQFAGESATAREEIERQYEERLKQINQDKAKRDKRNAMINITVDTAQAVVAALGNKPFTPGNFVLASIVGAIGAAQLAMVASQPLPEYFRGTMNAPEGWAMVDEKRPEVHTDRQGNIKSFGEQKANYRYLSAGDKIYKSYDEWYNVELKGLLGDNSILPFDNGVSSLAPIVNVESGIKKQDLERAIDKMTQQIMQKETTVIHMNKSGVEAYKTRNGNTVKLQNNILTLKGGIV